MHRDFIAARWEYMESSYPFGFISDWINDLILSWSQFLYPAANPMTFPLVSIRNFVGWDRMPYRALTKPSLSSKMLKVNPLRRTYLKTASLFSCTFMAKRSNGYPLTCRCSFSREGISFLHQPHQVVQKFMRTILP